MAYRSIKRVLGETNLERKCRLLFGICLLLLVAGAFSLVDRVTENLLLDSTRDRANRLISMQLLRLHFEAPQFTRDVNTSVAKDLQSPDVPFEILVLDPALIQDDGTTLKKIKPRIPVQGEERELVESLQQRIQDRLALTAKQNLKSDNPPGSSSSEPSVLEAALPAAIKGEQELFAQRFVGREYHYYEPLNFTANCLQCHSTADEPVAAADQTAHAAAAPRIDHVVKIVMSSSELQDAMNWTRAILISVAIMIVCFSIFALYLIVRYVIVKPLQHLQHVSDDISQGEIGVKAELSTGDEFEELASSFNRMVRHMTDTQNKLQHVNDDLDHKVDELAQVNMRLYEMNQLKSDFLANMSHELRTPLNSIIGFSEVLQGIDSLSDKQKKFATNIRASGHLLLQMINEILDLAKLEAGKMEVHPREFRIETIVQAHCEMVRPLTQEKNIDLRIQCADDLPLIYQDQVKVQQIFNNLLSNAIKFTPEGGRITTTVNTTDHGNLRIILEDTGVGIAEEDREIIFEKFRQGTIVTSGDTLTREFAGTGLGLSIVKELCHLLNGRVTVESNVGKGSIFTVTLPVQYTTDSLSVVEFNKKFADLTRTRSHDSRGDSNYPQNKSEPAAKE
jgi:signal transduction histidine kinase